MWRHLYVFQVWPPDCVACISYNFGHHVALLALVDNLATRRQMARLALLVNVANSWCFLHWFQFWPPDGATCIATLPMIVLLTSSVGIDSILRVRARVTSVKFQQGHRVREIRSQDPKIGPGIPGMCPLAPQPPHHHPRHPHHYHEKEI